MPFLETRNSTVYDQGSDTDRQHAALEAADRVRALIYENQREWNPSRSRRVGQKVLESSDVKNPESL